MRSIVLSLAAVATFAVGACGGATNPGVAASSAPDPTPESTVETTTTPPPTTESGPAKTPQGWLMKGIGEMAGLGAREGTTLETAPIKFTVDKIDVNPKCHQYGTKAKPGNKTVVLHVTMTTGVIDQDQAFAAALIFNPYSLKGITSDGFIHDAQPGQCTDFDKRFPSEVAPNGKYSGTVEVELPANATSVASAEGATGWAWPLP